jgi:hypothetical protein
LGDETTVNQSKKDHIVKSLILQKRWNPFLADKVAVNGKIGLVSMLSIMIYVSTIKTVFIKFKNVLQRKNLILISI